MVLPWSDEIRPTWSGFVCRLIAEQDSWTAKEDFLKEVLFSAYAQSKSQTEIINAMPLYPTENSLWDENQIPSVHYTGDYPNPACHTLWREKLCLCLHEWCFKYL